MHTIHNNTMAWSDTFIFTEVLDDSENVEGQVVHLPVAVKVSDPALNKATMQVGILFSNYDD